MLLVGTQTNAPNRRISARRSLSGQWRYTLTGVSPLIRPAGAKSAPLSERMTVSVRSGRILAESVPQLERRNRSARLASVKATSRNCVASSGEIALSRSAIAARPERIASLAYGRGALPSSRAARKICLLDVASGIGWVLDLPRSRIQGCAWPATPSLCSTWSAIPSSQPAIRQAAARSGGQGWPLGHRGSGA